MLLLSLSLLVYVLAMGALTYMCVCLTGCHACIYIESPTAQPDIVMLSDWIANGILSEVATNYLRGRTASTVCLYIEDCQDEDNYIVTKLLLFE